MKKWIPFVAAGLYALYAPLPTWYTKHADKHALRQAGGGKVMLTFDDGPDPRYTGRLLELLARYNVPASFFVTAEHALACPELIAEMKRRGHLIGFHSASHQNALLTAPWTVRKDFEKMKLAADYLGVPFRWYRPPWGHANLMTRYEIERYGLRLVMWDVMCEDWQRSATPEGIAQKLLERVHRGAVICLHDSGGAQGAPEHTLGALEMALPKLLARGYEFVKVDGTMLS